MTNLIFLIKSLSDKNNTVACGAMKTLAELSEQSNEVYAYMDTFAQKMLNTEDRNNVDKFYNTYTLDEIQSLFPVC